STMTIPLKCDQCGKRYAVPEEMAGKSVKCKACRQVLRVPSPVAPPPASAPAPGLDIYGLDDMPAPGAAASGSSSAPSHDEEAPALPRAGMPVRPKTKEEKKAFDKRVKAKDEQRSSFTQPLFGLSLGGVLVVALFGWRMYHRVVRPLRNLASASATAEER